MECIGTIVQSNQPIDGVCTAKAPSRKLKRGLAFTVPLIAAFLFLHSLPSSNLNGTVELDLNDSPIAKAITPEPTKAELPPKFAYTVKSGDSLSQIFDQLGFPYSDMMSVMETDLDYLVLDTLRPGDKMRFWQDEASGALGQLEVQRSVAEKAFILG